MISVVIPARDEAEFLPATLRALSDQSYRNFEAIVVANGCKDQTADVARKMGARVFELEHRGLGAARNLGGREAHGQILVFLDADTLLPREALSTIAARFRRSHGCGTVWGEPDSRRLSHKLIYAVKNLIHATHLHTGSAGVILCWKDYFLKVGGFDEGLYLRENSHLMKRLRKYGRYCFIASTGCITSMRRYEAQGTGDMVRMWFKVWLKSFTTDLRHQTYEDWEQQMAEKKLARTRGTHAVRREVV